MSKEILQKDIKKLIELYFKQNNVLYQMQYNSFSYFIEKIIFNRLKSGPNIFKEYFTTDKVYRHMFSYENISLRPPMLENEDEYKVPEIKEVDTCITTEELLDIINKN